MAPDKEDARLAPINALLRVTPPATMKLSIMATVELAEGATLDSVKTEYVAQLSRYLPVALDEGEIKYSRVAAALTAVEGANDYTDLKIGIAGVDAVQYDTKNITIDAAVLPVIDIDNLILISGEVEGVTS